MIFPINQIMLLNIGVLLLIALFIFSGYKNGFLLKVIGCVSYLVIIFVSWFLSPALAGMVQIYPLELTPFAGTFIQPFFYQTLNRITIFFLVFIALCIIVSLVKPLFKGLGKIPILSQINTILGVVFGFLQALIACMVITLIFHTPIFTNGTQVIEKSVLKPIDQINEKVLFVVSDTIAQWDSLQKIITPSETLLDEDYQNINEWMRRQGIEDEKINQFISSLQGD